MLSGRPVLFFDYVDPGSYLVGCVVDRIDPGRVEWRPFEVRVPPDPMIDPQEAHWRDYQLEVSGFAEGLDVPMSVPSLIPWTRKAHELAEHAREKDCYDEVRRALFRAHFVEGVDIGRIDVLVEIARGAGLDGSEARAALDVDRHASDVSSSRALGGELDVIGVPTLVRGHERLEGLHSPGDIEAWIAST